MAVLVSDSFNRSDSTLGTTDSYAGGTAKTWSSIAGTWGILSNQAYLSAVVADGFAVVDSAVADVKVSVAIKADDFNTAGIYFRCTDVNNRWRLVKGSGQLYLQKKVSGTQTTVLNPTGLTFANGDIISVVAQGNTITIYLNGVAKGSTTDTFNQTVTKHGIGYQSASASSCRWDDFQIESTGGTDISVTVPIATATNSALAPSVTTQKQISITSVVATVDDQALPPTVSSTSNVSVTSVTPTSSFSAGIPVVSTGVNVTSTTASSASSAIPPFIGSVDVTVNGVVASVSSQFIPPNVTIAYEIISVIDLEGIQTFSVSLQGSIEQTVQVLGLKDNIVLLEGEI